MAVKLLTYLEAAKEAEKHSEAEGKAVYLIPVHGFRLTTDLEDAVNSPGSEVIRSANSFRLPEKRQ